MSKRAWRALAKQGLLREHEIGIYIVREYADRLAISRQDKQEQTWSEVQKVKTAVWGDRVAVEVYPAPADVVDKWPTRHLWSTPALVSAVAAECHHAEFERKEAGDEIRDNQSVRCL